MNRKALLWGTALTSFTLIVLFAAVSSPLQADSESTSLSSKPNIIVIMTDDQDGYSVPVMRNVMSNSGGSWFWFNHGYSVDSIGGVARVSLLTGLHSHDHRIFGNKSSNRLDDRNTLAVWLQEEGYYTALIGKYLNGYPWDRGATYKPPGWDYFEHLFHKRVDDYHDSTNALLTDVIDNSDQPFFLLLAHRAPQRPAKPPVRYENADVSIVPEPATSPNFAEADVSDKPGWVKAQPVPKPGGYPDRTINGYPGYMWDTNWIREERKRALRQVITIDDGIQSMIDLLAAKGELDNTVIFYLSDSGYSWGNHRRTGRACPYEECNLLPYLVFYPGAPTSGGNQPEVVDRLVTNMDVSATIVELTGIRPRRSPQAGSSLLPLLESYNPANAPWSDVILLENRRSPKYYGVRTTFWKYVEYDDGFRELYDMMNDPFELQNLAYQPGHTAIMNELSDQLDRLLANESPSTPAPTRTPGPTSTSTPTRTPTPSRTPTSTVTASPTFTPSPTATDTPTPGPTDTPDPNATETPLPTDTPEPTATDTPGPTLTPTNTPVPGSGPIVLLSSTDSGNIGGVSFADEDILSYDSSKAPSEAWSLLFDGSQFGLASADIDAFHVASDESHILLSLSAPITLAGLGLVDDSDILSFRPHTPGNFSQGQLEMFFDGSMMGLGTASEDIDALSVLPDGRLLVSLFADGGQIMINGSVARPRDEDILVFTGQTGASTSGSWAWYFDGSDIGLTITSEDVNSLSVSDDETAIYFTTTGWFQLQNRLAGRRSDVVVCYPSNTSSGLNSNCGGGAALYMQASLGSSTNGFVDGVQIVAP